MPGADDSDSHNGMPRKAGNDAPGALHHIIVRGIEPQQMFRHEAERDSFVARLVQVLAETATAACRTVGPTQHIDEVAKRAKIRPNFALKCAFSGVKIQL